MYCCFDGWGSYVNYYFVRLDGDCCIISIEYFDVGRYEYYVGKSVGFWSGCNLFEVGVKSLVYGIWWFIDVLWGVN